MKSNKAKSGRVVKKAVEENNELWDIIINEVLIEDYKRQCNNLLRGIEVEKSLVIKDYIKTIGSNIKRLISVAEKAEEIENNLKEERVSSDILNKVNIV